MRLFRVVTNTINSVSKNLRRMLTLAWAADKGLLIGYYLTSGLGAIFPIITSYTYKLLVDYLVESKDIGPSIPFIIIVVLASRYLAGLAWDFTMWALKNTYFDHLFRYKLQNALNLSFYKKTSSLDIGHLENTKTQDLIAKASDTFTWRPPDFLRQFSYFFNNVVAFVSSFVLLITYGWLIPFLISFLSIPRLLLRAKYGKLQWSIYGSGAPEIRKLWYFRWLLSHKISVIESRVFQSSEALLKKFSKIQNYLYEINKKPVKNFLKVAGYPQVFEVLVIFIFAYIKLPQVMDGRMSIGNFTFFLSLLDRLSDSGANMILNFGDMYENNLYVNHYFEVMGLPKLIKEPQKPDKIDAQPYPPKIEFKKVSFRYPGSKELVLNSVSFTIEPGQNIAIVGRNGAGKTTIVKLLCRFYDVTSGEIIINGVSIKDVKLSDWYMYLGTLFQEFIHYDFTVAENIMMGNPDLEDRARMKLAAKQSGAAEFIEELPKKYNQVLGRQFEGGVELSQGQWQKLAVARAFYEAAPILILDEPTSAIDVDAEYEIFQNLQKSYKDKSLFLISHRFSTVRNADKIIVLEKGRITEEGSHPELLAKDGTYARMFKKQAKGYQ